MIQSAGSAMVKKSGLMRLTKKHRPLSGALVMDSA